MADRAAAFAIIIPARHASTRYPGKPLAMLAGATGEARPLIRRSWDGACAVAGGERVFVATDDDRIAEVVRGFGGQVLMTGPERRNGTERCAEAVAQIGADIVVNWQGDAPLTPAFMIERLVAALVADPEAAMATAAVRCSPATYAHLAADAAAGRVGGTTVVTDRQGRALYFSKRLLPHVPDSDLARAHDQTLLHLGLYAYRAEALARYAALDPGVLEELEGLEQLRFLEAGLPVRVVAFDPPDWSPIELNNPADVPVIEAILKERGIA
ncbi:3-deoxy-manno-octulosonate cytidylyltransferase [Novosphingobium bradum]|uniref:3-deoxy-manno-octulosonate cytidylyltransferase n=1 Tax=Novosphingobium bradum TaxID=1737444 RepID=A0ABV7IKN3_9SPHN